MNIFGLNETSVVTAVRGVRKEFSDNTVSQCEHIFARAAWACITEPGDGIAGELIHCLGAREALHLLLARPTAAVVSDRLRAAATKNSGRRESVLLQKDALEAATRRWLPRLSSHVVMHSFAAAHHIGAQLLIAGDPQWLDGVNDLGVHAPLVLWVRGQIGALHREKYSISLVGARAATGYGEYVACEASSGLVDRGFTIISGAAYGIDAIVHRAALASAGTTIAFLAGGVDRFYPRGNDALLHRILREGAILSEVCCGFAPTKWRFLQRNRLIAASSQATVVLEAGSRSGSLNTAGHAAELGRPLGAVPGPVTSATSVGCHKLIRDYDAVCVTKAIEMAALVIFDATMENPLTSSMTLTSEAVRVLDAMSTRSGRSARDIAVRAGIAIMATTAQLGLMQLDGTVRERDGFWTKIPRRK